MREFDEENLKDLIKGIQSNEIMLPDFQRQFDWDIEKQISLVTSILARLPIGGILLLTGSSSEYKSRQIGLDPQIPIGGNIPEKTKFLLDGQQRVTCIINVFSDVIHEKTDKMVSRLASTNLKTRFYIKIPKWSCNDIFEKDIFGIKTLDFPLIGEKEEPEFLTEDIKDYVECRPFLGNEYKKDKPYLPGERYNSSLDSYCISSSDEYYLIPMFLLIGTDISDIKVRSRRLNAIITAVAEYIGDDMYTYYTTLEKDNDKDDFALEIIKEEDCDLREEYRNSEDKDETFQNIIKDKKSDWATRFRKYLDLCVEHMRLTCIDMPEGSRERAIDIYEKMNLGGLSLNTFDLVAARAAKESKTSLFERIKEEMSNNRDYIYFVSEEIEDLIPDEYNASTYSKDIDVRASKECQSLFLEVLGLYCNNPDYSEDKIKGAYSKSKEILKLDAKQINNNCEKVCIAVDRTICYLQTRCGVKALSDVNYKLMVRIIAYIFTNDKWYRDKKVQDLIEAWYWTAVFSGEFDKDQNTRFESNLRNLIKIIEEPCHDKWINDMRDRVLNQEYYSDKDFLLMKKADEDRIPKEHLSTYFCQFLMRNAYADLITVDNTVSVFCKEKLEKHHILPLGSKTKIGESTTQLRKEKENILNSPLNYMYITSKTNKIIKDTPLEEYEDHILAEIKDSLGILNFPKIKELNDPAKTELWLDQRYENMKNKIIAHIAQLLKTK